MKTFVYFPDPIPPVPGPFEILRKMADLREEIEAKCTATNPEDAGRMRIPPRHEGRAGGTALGCRRKEIGETNSVSGESVEGFGCRLRHPIATEVSSGIVSRDEKNIGMHPKQLLFSLSLHQR
jgi:hypothetical protein